MKSGLRYRVEGRNRKGSTSRYYYLIREFWVDGKRFVITKYIKSGAYPSDAELEEFVNKHASDIEAKAQEKFVSTRVSSFQYEYLSADAAKMAETIRYLYRFMQDLISVDEVRYYEQQVEYQYIHGTTSVEGNTLTYSDTVELLEHGVVPSNKSMREIYEVQNFKEVAAFRNSHRGRVDFAFIRKLHKLIMANILEEPGKFRESDGFLISGCDFQLTPSILIEEELAALIDDYYAKIEAGFHPFECAVMFHYRFECIHPFVDGNGRVGRELLNYLLMKEGYPRLLVLGEKRKDYLSALRMGNADEFSVMVDYFVSMITAQRLETIRNNIDRKLGVTISGSISPEEEKPSKEQKTLSSFFDEEGKSE